MPGIGTKIKNAEIKLVRLSLVDFNPQSPNTSRQGDRNSVSPEIVDIGVVGSHVYGPKHGPLPWKGGS